MQRELCRFAGTMTRAYAKTLFLSFVAFAAMTTFAAAPTEVWVSDSDGVDSDDTEVADGTEQLPYKTIQFGVNKVATGGTVKIKAGIYDKGETYGGGHSNRVAITKKVVLDGVDGKENTHIVGFRDFVNGNALGCGKTAVRCVWIDKSKANGTVIKGFTIRDGGSNPEKGTANGTQYARYYGGGVQGTATTSDTSLSAFSDSYVVDCVVSNCAAGQGGGINGVNAVRCLITGNSASSYGAGARVSRLLHCLVTKNNTTTTSGVRGDLYWSYAYNCTVAKQIGAKTVGAESSYLYNTIVAENEANNVANTKLSTNSFTSSSVKYLYDAANGDYRLAPGTKAVGGGLTEHLSLVALPDGVNAYVDYASNTIDSASLTCDAGCIQGYVIEREKTVTITAANGGIAVAGATIGENTLTVGDVVTITPAAGTRPCTGVKVNGVNYLFDDTPTVEVTVAADFPSSFAISAIYTTHWYVNAAVENDSGTGFRQGDPKKFLASAVALAASGDTVHAAAGRYDEGSSILNSGRPVRVYVPENVTLVADEGPTNTYIVGAPATEPLDSRGFGLGTNAMRCVCIAKNGHLRGFTLTGGRTDYSTATADISYLLYTGGGVAGGQTAYRDRIYIENCIISNNYASFGGGARAVNLVHCRVFDNKALNDGGALVESLAYGSVFNRNRQGNNYDDAACRNVDTLVACTLGPDNLTLDGTITNRALNGAISKSGQIHGCLVLGNAYKGVNALNTPISYCVFKGSVGFANTNCIFNAANLKVDDDLRPVAGQNDAVDAWDNAQFTSKSGTVLPTDYDIYGAPRIRNGRIDIGALESDPKPWYGKLLDGKGKYVTVTEADNMVTNIANGVTLQDGMAVSLTWSSVADDAIRMGHVRVTGEGTLTLMKDGEPYATYTEADGEVEFSFAATGKSAALVFSFEGEGSADVYSFSSPIGTMLILK